MDSTGADRRRYDSPLRAEQAERTRERLLEAATDMLADAGPDALTVREVAKRARVSAPTAYRNFPSRDDLLDALGDWLNAKVGFVGYPETLSDCPAFAKVLYPGFAANEAVIRAQLAHPAGKAVRERALKRRVRLIREAVDREVGEAQPELARQELAGLVHLLLSAGTFVHLRDRWGLDGDQIAEATGWALRTLVDAVSRGSAPHSEEEP